MSIPITNDSDVVGIYDDSYAQVLQGAVQIKINVSEDSKLMDQALEDGSTISDHRILLPIEAELSVLLDPADYRNAYQQAKDAFIKGTVFSIKTRVTMHQNMVLARLPREETSEDPDLIKMLISFREVRYFKAQFQALPARSVKNKGDASTVKRGEQSGSGNSSTAYKVIFGK